MTSTVPAPSATRPRVELPAPLLALLRRPSPGFLSTLMPDGTPHATSTWVDTDGRHILVNTARGRIEAENVGRDSRVAVAVADPHDPSHAYRTRGRVLAVTEEGADHHLRELAHRYLGTPFAPGAEGTRRVIVVIEPLRVQDLGTPHA